MGYALESLIKIRVRREDVARGELTVARLKMHQAEEELKARKEELNTYETTKEERRNRIYATIIGRTVNADALELAREGISRIDEEGNLRANNVLQAERILNDREKDVDVARQGLVVATKNRMKIDEHRNDWLKAEAAENDYRQEIELEDFTGKKVQDDRDY